jgi:Na+/H+ antiporter NhaD/arsenite permease-like protein
MKFSRNFRSEILIEFILLTIFVLAFGLIIFEEILKINKAKSTLFLGTLSWILLFMYGAFNGHNYNSAFNNSILEIATLWLFLVCAMTFVAYLDKRGFIEHLLCRFFPKSISIKVFAIVLSLFTFVMSSIIDNLTATLVAITVILTLPLEKKHIVPLAVLIVFAANAGGVALITGDVTTLMIFMAHKVTMSQLVWLFIPAFVSLVVLLLLLVPGMKGKISIALHSKKLRKSDYGIAFIFLGTVISIMVGHLFFHIPPVLTFLFGLSVMFLVGWLVILKKREDELKLLECIREIEFDTLFFFLGVLLLVGSLKEVQILSYAQELFTLWSVPMATFSIGVLSAIVDNIPLTAALLKSDLILSTHEWLALTFSVGVGGSLLSIGSAAGVIAMCKLKQVTFLSYLKYSFAIFIAFVAGLVALYVLPF